MAFRIGAVTSHSIKDQIPSALQAYSSQVNNEILFDLDSATDIRLANKGQTTAESVSIVRMGRFIALLNIFVFLPGDSWDGKSTHELKGLRTNVCRRSNRLPKPQGKFRTEREVHLPIASFTASGVAVPFAGCLDLIGLSDTKKIEQLGTLGQVKKDFENYMSTAVNPRPQATFTLWRSKDRNFGDPGVIYNDTSLLQICGFITTPRWYEHRIIDALHARMPEDSSWPPE